MTLKRYRCPKCKGIIELDLEKRTVNVIPPKGITQSDVWAFPTHVGCELAKSIDKIRLGLLERLE